MDFNFLPNKFLSAINLLNLDKLTEIRCRVNYPVIIKYSGRLVYLSPKGATTLRTDALIFCAQDIIYIINKVTENSIYAFNDKIKQGYLTTENGLRIGLAGECVFNDGKIQTIKKFTSLNIRIPHFIDGCSNAVFEKICNGQVLNTLIVSPPGFGKTTILKDLSLKLNKCNLGSILIIDERGEFFEVQGENIDKILYSDKLYALDYGVRSLSPNIVITDELSSKDDWTCINHAINSGVKIIASCHGYSIESLLNKEFFNNIFDRYIILNGVGEPGQIKFIYDKEFNLL